MLDVLVCIVRNHRLPSGDELVDGPVDGALRGTPIPVAGVGEMELVLETGAVIRARPGECVFVREIGSFRLRTLLLELLVLDGQLNVRVDERNLDTFVGALD